MAANLRQRNFAPWLVAAAVLHCGVWALRRDYAREAAPATSVATAPPVEFEISLQEPEGTQAADVPSADVPSVVAVETRQVRALERAASRAPARVDRRVVAPAPVATQLAETVAGESAGAEAGEPAVGRGGTDTTVGNSAEPSRASAQLESAASATPLERLAELGYGAPHAAALQPYLDVKPLVAAQERLDQHLAQAILDHDRDHSLGIEGPVTNALHTAAMGVVVPKSLSKVIVTIGRDGKLADFRILETDRDARALAALGERVKRLLAAQTVKVPPGRAVEFIYEVRSEVQLPSGRAPGLAVEVAGIPVKKGRDKKSSKISILTPTLKFESQSQADPDRNGKVTQTLPQLVYGISVLGFDGDPVDLLANERQVVHTRLLQQRVL